MPYKRMISLPKNKTQLWPVEFGLGGKHWFENLEGVTRLRVLAGEIGIHDTFPHTRKPFNAWRHVPSVQSTVL